MTEPTKEITVSMIHPQEQVSSYEDNEARRDEKAGCSGADPAYDATANRQHPLQLLQQPRRLQTPLIPRQSSNSSHLNDG